MKRGVGFCENAECEDFSKGVFLLSHGTTFYCPRCRGLGNVVPEHGHTDNDHQVFREAHVHFNYEPIEKRYREIAIVRDDSLPENDANTYHLFSPLIRTEVRALKVAESILGNLNRYQGLLDGDGIPRTTEVLLSFDDELSTFSSQLKKLAKEWETSGSTERAAMASAKRTGA